MMERHKNGNGDYCCQDCIDCSERSPQSFTWCAYEWAKEDFEDE